MWLVQDGYQIQIKFVTTFLKITWSSYEFMIKVKILVTIKWSYSPPPNLLMLMLEWL